MAKKLIKVMDNENNQNIPVVVRLGTNQSKNQNQRYNEEVSYD
mgnify:CR=1 FL=1